MVINGWVFRKDYFSGSRALPSLDGKQALSLPLRLLSIQLIFLIALTVVSAVAWQAVQAQYDAARELIQISEGQRRLQDGDMMHDAIRGDVNASLLSDDSAAPSVDHVMSLLHNNGAQLLRDLDEMATLALPMDLRSVADTLRPKVSAYIEQAEKVVRLSGSDRKAALAELAAFEKLFGELLIGLRDATERFSEACEQAVKRSSAAALVAQQWILMGGLSAAVLVWLTVANVSRSIRSSLRKLRRVSDALSAGDLTVRNEIRSRDEIGLLAQGFNTMADNLQSMVERMRAEADRDAFGTQLSEALEMADTEAEVHQVAARAMVEIARDMPMELLLADSSKAHLERACAHPLAGAPGCDVDSPFHCVAVRRGNPVVFDTSEALNACTRLHNRPGGPVSAVCVPLSFMGRALGTLHVTSLALAPPDQDAVAQLTTLGIQVGARIGTVRAFQRTQTRANADPLTGLMNRRALEEHVRHLVEVGANYAVGIVDLDHFKKLNDTHGHEAGDRALRLFADVLRKSLRDNDKAARWGGEEFVLILPRCSSEQAVAVCERIRQELADAAVAARSVKFTASFGIADSGMGATLEEQLRVADAALYAAKRGGRDRVTLAGSLTAEDIGCVRASEPEAAVNLRLVAQEV